MTRHAQFRPGLGEVPRAGPADAREPVAARRAADMFAELGQQPPGLGQHGHLAAHVLAQRAEGLAVRAPQDDPAQPAKPVLIQRDTHAAAPVNTPTTNLRRRPRPRARGY
jgi:hypothetical protein